MLIYRALVVFLWMVSFSLGGVLKSETLEIYKDRAFLTEVITVNFPKETKIMVQLPLGVEISRLNISVEPETCYVSQVRREPLEKSIEDNLNQYKEQIELLKSQLKTVDTEISFLEKLDINKKEKPFEFLQQYYKYYFKKLQEKGFIKQQIQQKEKELRQLEKKYGKKYSLILECDSNTKGKVRFTFSPPVKAQQDYVISGDSLNRRVFITTRLFIKQNSGKDLSGITVRYHSYRKTTAIEPPPPFIHPLKGERVMSLDKVKAAATSYSYEETLTKAFFQVNNIDLPEDKEVVLTVSRKDYPADFSVYIDGYATVTPFLKATFKADRFYPPSFNGTYYIDGLYVGRGKVPPVEGGKKNHLFFGEDIFIDVSKYQIKDYTEEGFFGREKTEKKWRYIIKNKHKREMKITLVDKIPVSHSDKMEVEPFSTLKWKKKDEKGLITWEFTLGPDEEIKFEFGYRILRKK